MNPAQQYRTRAPGGEISGAPRIVSALFSGWPDNSHRCSPVGKPAVCVRICAMVMSRLSAGASRNVPSRSHRHSLPASMARRVSMPTTSGLVMEARS